MTKDGLDLAIATQKARRELGELDVTITIDSFIELCEAARRTEERAPQELAWLSYTDADRLAWDPFDGADRDVEVKCKTTKMVTTRKPHKCHGIDGAASTHDMPIGTRAKYETAIVDGEWGRYYICVACIDKWLAEFRPSPMNNYPR